MMTRERLSELLGLSDERDWPEGYEMIDEIERLQAVVAAFASAERVEKSTKNVHDNCNASWWGRTCTLLAGHTGRHVVPGDAIWADVDSPDCKPHEPVVSGVVSGATPRNSDYLERIAALHAQLDAVTKERDDERATKKPLTKSRCTWCGFEGDIDDETIWSHVRECTISPHARLVAERDAVTKQLREALREVVEKYTRVSRTFRQRHPDNHDCEDCRALDRLDRRVAHLLEVHGVANV